MAAFTSMGEAEGRARTLMGTGAAIVAHVQRSTTGVISVRVLRPLSLATFTGQDTVDGMNKAGAWDVLTDTTQT